MTCLNGVMVNTQELIKTNILFYQTKQSFEQFISTLLHQIKSIQKSNVQKDRIICQKQVKKDYFLHYSILSRRSS